MSSIDDRIVNMQFNNGQFEKGIAETSNSLEHLKSGLKLDGATEGIGAVQQAANRFSLANMEAALQNISSKFSVFGAIGFTIIQDLTNAVLNAGRKMVGALVDPIVQGGAKRALALQQAKFQFRGLGLDIDSTMAAALAAVKDTAFGLDDAATAAAQFGASGITAGNGLESVLRAVSGVAAQTGSSYEAVAQTFESVAGNGRLMGQDLLSLSARGVNAAATLAKSMGISEASVREMVTKGKISFKQFSDAMNNAFGANAAKANETYTGALSNMHAALARLGADVAGPYFFAMRDIFNALTPIFDSIHKALGPVIKDFNDFQTGGAAKGVEQLKNIVGPGLITSIHNVAIAIGVIGHALEQGFHSIFPENSTGQLISIFEFLKKITWALIPGSKAAGELQRTFAGLFAIFDIVGQIITSVIKSFVDLFGFTTKGAGSFLEFTAAIGDWLVRVDNAIKRGQVFQTFFNGLAAIIAVPLGILKTFFGIIMDGFKALATINTGGLDNFFTDVGSRFKGLVQIADFFQGFWNGVVKVSQAVWGFLKPLFIEMGHFLSDVATNVTAALKGLTFNDGIQLINTGIFAGFLFIVKNFFGKLKDVFGLGGKSFIGQLHEIFGALGENLKALQANTNAKTLTQIAIAIAILAASAVALSLVNTGKLVVALGAIGGLMKGLIVTFTSFNSITGVKGIKNSLAIVLMLQGMAGAILILAGAIAILGAVPILNLIQGTIALVAVMAALVGAMKLLAETGPEVLFAAGAIAILAPAMVLLAGAVALLGLIPFENLAKGIGAFVFLLGALVAALALLNMLGPEVLFGAGAIALIAPPLVLLTGVIAALGALPMMNLAKGIGAFVFVLAGLVGAIALLALIGPEVILGAVAIGLLAFAIVPLVGAIALLGMVPLINLAKGVGALVFTLGALVAALALLALVGPEVLLGAGALIITALAIAILVPPLLLLSAISWEGIGKVLTVLSAGLAILAVMGILLIPASVGFLLFGLALLAIGNGVFLAAEGIGLLAVGIAALTLVGAGGIAIFGLALDAFIQKLPALGTGIGAAFVSMVVAIGAQAGTLIVAFVQLLTAMLSAVDQVVPQIIKTATDIIVALINALVILIPLLVDAGLKIINGVLTGIAKNIGGITTQAINIISNFVTALANNLWRIINAAADLVVKFVSGLATAVSTHSSDFINAGARLFLAVVDGVSKAIETSGYLIRYAGQRIGQALLKGAFNALGISSPSKEFYKIGVFSIKGLVNALSDNTDDVTQSGKDIGQAAINGIKDSISNVTDLSGINLDMTPTIRPVLDLSAIKDGAKQIPGMLPGPSLSLDTSNNVATSVSLQEQAKIAQLTLDATKADPNAGKQVTFNQYNNSPKALSTSEVYRQTKNQLSTLKGDLGVVDQSGSS